MRAHRRGRPQLHAYRRFREYPERDAYDGVAASEPGAIPIKLANVMKQRT